MSETRVLDPSKTGEPVAVLFRATADELAELAIATTSAATRSRLLRALALVDAETAEALEAAMSAG